MVRKDKYINDHKATLNRTVLGNRKDGVCLPEKACWRRLTLSLGRPGPRGGRAGRAVGVGLTVSRAERC